jgi:hypothetical protein
VQPAVRTTLPPPLAFAAVIAATRAVSLQATAA